MAKNNFRAAIFDLDGTLLDTVCDIAAMINPVLQRFGLPQQTIDDYKRIIGDGLEAAVRRIAPTLKSDDPVFQKLMLAITEESSKLRFASTRAYDGIFDLLDEFTKRKFKLAVLSNRPEKSTRELVKLYLGKWKFEDVLGAGTSRPLKPDPAGAFEIAEKLDVPVDEFIYLGDSDTDMKTANAAGMYPVGALWGFRPREELIANGAKLLAEKPMDVFKILVAQQ